MNSKSAAISPPSTCHLSSDCRCPSESLSLSFECGQEICIISHFARITSQIHVAGLFISRLISSPFATKSPSGPSNYSNEIVISYTHHLSLRFSLGQKRRSTHSKYPMLLYGGNYSGPGGWSSLIQIASKQRRLGVDWVKG